MKLLILTGEILATQLLTLKIMQQKRLPSLSLNFLIATISCVSCKIKEMEMSKICCAFSLTFYFALSIRRRKKEAFKRNFTMQNN